MTDGNIEGSKMTDENVENSKMTDENAESSKMTDEHIESSKMTDENMEGSGSDSLYEINLNKVVDKKVITDLDPRTLVVRCSACGRQINHQSKMDIKKHRKLNVITCKECYEFYGSSDFSQDESGYYNYCTWCGNGGKLVVCGYCPNGFCNACIQRNFGRKETWKTAKNTWKCYMCNKKQLKPKVKFCDFILSVDTKSFLEKRKKAIEHSQLTQESPKPVISETWLQSAFDESKYACQAFCREMSKLKLIGAGKKKSLKHVVKKLEDLIISHKTSLKNIVNSLNNNYASHVECQQSEWKKELNSDMSLENSMNSFPEYIIPDCIIEEKKNTEVLLHCAEDNFKVERVQANLKLLQSSSDSDTGNNNKSSRKGNANPDTRFKKSKKTDNDINSIEIQKTPDKSTDKGNIFSSVLVNMPPIPPSNLSAPNIYTTVYDYAVPIYRSSPGSFRKRKNYIEMEEAPKGWKKEFVAAASDKEEAPVTVKMEFEIDDFDEEETTKAGEKEFPSAASDEKIVPKAGEKEFATVVSDEKEVPKVREKEFVTSTSDEKEVPKAMEKRFVTATSNEEEIPKAGEKELVTSTSNEKETHEAGEKEFATAASDEAKINFYEQMIEQKRAERMALFSSMNFDQFKNDFSEVITGMKKRKKKKCEEKPKRPYLNRRRAPGPIRKSRRLVELEDPFSENSPGTLAVKNVVEEPIPPNLTFEAALTNDSSYQDCIRDLHLQEIKSGQDFLVYNKDVFKSMMLNECKLSKVARGIIHAASWYPSKEDLVIAAGDRFGNLGLWKIQDTETTEAIDYRLQTHVFKIHKSVIPYIQFSVYDPAHLITSSYDGTMRCCDLVNHTFNEIYVTNQSWITWFDFLSSSTFLISHSNGEVSIFDRNSKRKTAKTRHACHDSMTKTVSLHPGKNVFVTCDNKGLIRLWDLRMLTEKPVTEIVLPRGLYSAYFSPVTGNSLLASSNDGYISMYDSTTLTQDIKLKARVNLYDLPEKKSYSFPFKATWLPNSDDMFSVDSGVADPRSIQIFDKDVNPYYSMETPHLKTVTSVHCFHPYRSILAGGNSSGKFFVFT